MKTKKIIPNILAIAFLGLSLLSSSVAYAAVNTLTATEDPTKSTFKIVICNGPTLPDTMQKPAGYVDCDFNGLMLQIQHFINICMVLGVFAAIVLFTYAGYLFLTGKEGDRKKAYDVFPKVFWGFIIMLSAWFVVYQILSWLTGNSIFTKLLGNP